MNEGGPRLKLVSSDNVHEVTDAEREREYKRLVEEYACEREVNPKPEWCVWVDAGNGIPVVLHWIRFAEGSELIARKIAKYLNGHGGVAGADMTEWNPKLKRDPIYVRHEGFDTEPPPQAA